MSKALTGEVANTQLTSTDDTILGDETNIEVGFLLLADESSFLLLADESSKLLLNKTIKPTVLSGEVANTRLSAND